jgi:beta-ureidopropionase / N-carbamoyl-L-amino-acid hydrolase
MNRRSFLGSLAFAQLARADGPAPIPARINGGRLRRHLEELSVYGRPAGGTFADGVSRVAYSDADVAGRRYVTGLMQAAGLKPRVDPAGNIFARRAGSEAALPPLLFGSHIDSVPNGGNFDGDVGSLSAIEVVQTLNEAGIATRRPLEVVVWANEEGVAFNNGLDGSRAAAGHTAPGDLDMVWNGLKKRDALRKIGGDPDRFAEARLQPGSFHCYLELHIEQGGVLDRAGIPIGVVEGIVSIDRYEAEIRGFANHAGTTPMPDRRDALLASSYLTIAVNEIVRREPGRQVGTVGQIAVTPNAPNVVPGRVVQTIELRDLDAARIHRLALEIQARARDIASRTQTEVTIRQIAHHDAALATPGIQTAIENAAARLELPTRRLPSGAGHDAQMMALLGPMGMIFVPSVGGISHAPREFSKWEDCANGANVLLETLMALAD